MRIDSISSHDGAAFSKELFPPAWLKRVIPVTDHIAELVASTRKAIRSILRRDGDRLLVLVGPCSIHDPHAARQYAQQLLELRNRLRGDLEIVMRVYLEKPRTTVGWKGLINDPFLDGTGSIAEGLEIGRGLLHEINQLGLPTATEMLDPLVARYIDDLLAWVAIGARTTTSPLHRQLASGLSLPVGFKNAIDGNVQLAVDAIQAASCPHSFISVSDSGRLGVVSTFGNDAGHLVLRGGLKPNYAHESVVSAGDLLHKAGLSTSLVVDASHGNSQKNHKKQMDVCHDLCSQLAAGSEHIAGVMIESNIVAGRQDIEPGKPLVHGQSVTDACIDLDDTRDILEALAEAVRCRRDNKVHPRLAMSC